MLPRRASRATPPLWLGSALVLLALASPWGAPAAADSVVTHCTRDDEPVTDVDLGKAIAAGGHVTFACPPNTVIAMTRRHPVPHDTWIDGGGKVTLDGANATTMFEVADPAVTLSLSHLTIRRARPTQAGEGGIVTGRARVEIALSTLIDNAMAVRLSDGTVRVTDSEIRNGTGVAITAPNVELTRVKLHGSGLQPLQANAGTVSIRDSEIAASGSSVFTNCRLRIYGTRWSSSTSSAVDTDCETTIDLSHFNGNHGANGGALRVRAGELPVTIRGGDFTDNGADGEGGAIAFESADFDRRIDLRNVTFRSNHAANGGAIHLGGFLQNRPVLDGRGLLFADNTASGSGGGIAGTNATLRLTRSVFVGNRAGDGGGGIDLRLFAPRNGILANSLFTRNGAPHGSAFHGSGLRFVNVTLAANESGPAVAAFWPVPSLNDPEPWRLMRFENSAFYRNTPASCETPPFGKLVFDGGANLQFPAGGCPVSIPVADPGFDPLFVPAWGGPAIAAGKLPLCLAQPVAGTDLYGRHRPQGKSCSIGAVEGDLEDVVLAKHPEWADLPKDLPSPCDCARRPAPPPVPKPGPYQHSDPSPKKRPRKPRT
jgi:predicted outer membrane repeat protein